MKIKLALFTLITSSFISFIPSLVSAQDTVDTFSQYTNPHSICNYYRTQAGWVVERESDSECLVSLGSGKYKGFTQYYYSGNNWCYKLYSGSDVVSSLCVLRPNRSNVFTNEEFTKFAPYIVGVVVLVVILAVVSSATATSQSAATNSPSIRRGQGIRSKKPKSKKPPRIWNELGRKK